MLQKDWMLLPRKESFHNRLPTENIGNDVIRENISFGINIYRNAIKIPDSIVNELENILSGNDALYRWSPSLVNNYIQENIARTCFDFKYDNSLYEENNEKSIQMKKIYDIIKESIVFCMRDYEENWNFKMEYYEVFNFVKYGKNEFFKAHVDHGPYNCYTTSIVAYLNDDYEGGEIEWTRFGIKLKPIAGDIVIFPSNFIYEHESHKILDGIKYSVVVMSDYNDLNHKQ